MELLKQPVQATNEINRILLYGPPKVGKTTLVSQLDSCAIIDLEKKYATKSYGEFKNDLAEVVVNFLENFQEKYNNISDAEVKKILKEVTPS